MKKQTWKAAVSAAAMCVAAADLLCQCAKRVNALYMITPLEDVAKVIKAAYGVVEQYKHVAAQPAKHKGGDDPEPEPAPEAAK